MLRLKAFGSLSVRRSGGEGSVSDAPLAIQRRALAVLAFLAAHSEDGVSRDKLLACLWPESDMDRARNALRQTLHSLRRDLGVPGVLEGGETLRINRQLLESDLLEFETASRGGALEQMVQVYGGPFLDGFHLSNADEFERWVEGQRQAYSSRARKALEVLANDATSKGESQRALGYWKQLTTLDPLDSAIARQYMLALVEAGNVPGALQHARVHETLLREELGCSLDPATAQVMEELRSGRLGGPASLASAVSLVGLAPSEAPTGPRTAEESEPVGIHERLQAALSGRYDVEYERRDIHDGRTRTFVVKDLRHDRNLALRVIRRSLASSLDLKRFLQEITLTARLAHPNILPAMDSGEIDGQPWYTTPFPDGITLRERLAKGPAVSRGEAYRVALSVASALDFAHRHGVLHRDVSPENVLLVGDHAFLTNLAFARAIDVSAGTGITESGLVVGSPAYMSPEQVSGEANLDGRSDIYSLGLVLYEMLAGEPVFSGPTAQAILSKRKMSTASLLSPIPVEGNTVPSALARAMAETPEERFRTAADFMKALEAGTSSVPDHSPALGRRILGVLALAMLLLIAVALLLTR